MLKYNSFLDDSILSLFDKQSKTLIENLELSEDNPSVDIDKIIEILDLEVKTTKLDIHSGKFDSEQNIIYVNTDEPETRQRFTKAHELGHFVHKHGESARYLDDSFYNSIDRQKETEANKFAVNLLMPDKLVLTLFNKYRNGFETSEAFLNSSAEDFVEYLAKKMDVSNQSMKYRLINLRIIKETNYG